MLLRPERQLTANPASRAQCLRNVEDGPKTSQARPQTSCGIPRSRSSRSGPRDRSYASRWRDLPSSRIPDQWRPVGSRQRWATNLPPEEAVQHRRAISVSHRGLTQRKENLTPSLKRSKGRGSHPTPSSAGLTAAPKGCRRQFPPASQALARNCFPSLPARAHVRSRPSRADILPACAAGTNDLASDSSAKVRAATANLRPASITRLPSTR